MRKKEGDLELTCLRAAARRWLTAFLRQPAEVSEQMELNLEELPWRTEE
jgi:hypothetical protein